MIRKSLTAAVIALAAVSTAAPAVAQSIEIGRDGVRLVDPSQQQRGNDRRDTRRSAEIGERDAVRIARAEGVREVDEVRRTRGAYRVVGFDNRGDDIQVDVDRRSGDVISVR